MIAITAMDVLLWAVIGFFCCVGVLIICLCNYFMKYPPHKTRDRI